MSRLLRAAGIGALCGLLAACALLARPLWVRHRAALRQERLVASCGQGEMPPAQVALTVLSGGLPREGMAASLDGRNWYAPKDGQVRIAALPDRYDQVAATLGNRVLTRAAEVRLDAANLITLDVDGAPDLPELLTFEMAGGQDMSFSVPARNATGLALRYAPDGVSVARDGDRFALSVDERLAKHHFLCFAVKAENASGYAQAYVGLRGGGDADFVEIRTASELAAIGNRLSGRYRLVSDVDLSGMDDWQPIGSNGYPFTGVFDGGGHEIRGLHSDARLDAGVRTEDGYSFALFGHVKNAVIERVILREPRIECSASPESSLFGAALAVSADQSLIQCCAVFGGRIAPANGAGSGLVANAANSVLLDLFNSADVVTDGPNQKMYNTGGIAGGLRGYIARCANEGDVAGTHLTGGIVGYGMDATIVRCISSGQIRGAALVGEYPPGGLVQTLDAGSLRYACFVRGSAAVGGKVFWSGAINTVSAIAPEALRSPDALHVIGSFEGDAPDWAFAPGLAEGPVPCEVARMAGGREGEVGAWD